SFINPNILSNFFIYLQLFHPSSNTLNIGSSHYNKCTSSGEDTKGFYCSCSICDFILHLVCANILFINYPKRHDHTLTNFPRKNSLTCDVCALGDEKCFIYICYQCDFIIHKTCIYIPTTIKLSHHDHRLSSTPSLSIFNKIWSCGVDKYYGECSCVKSCNYENQKLRLKMLSRLKRYLLNNGRSTKPRLLTYFCFESRSAIFPLPLPISILTDDGVIKHFSHLSHYMRLDKKENDKMDDERRCQACILLVYENNIYDCIKCDFIFHETCVHLPIHLLYKWFRNMHPNAKL
ncbi:unnamed protein product, partial [Thlaspi arvense]